MRSDEDGTILAHNNTRIRLVDTSKKGGNAPRAPDKMRDFYPPQASYWSGTTYTLLSKYYKVTHKKLLNSNFKPNVE
jgi:hypothetical protein